MPDPAASWPHAPAHQLSENGTYFVTAGTYLKAHHFRIPRRLAVLQGGLLTVARDFSWQLEAWAVFSNHYHFVTHSPSHVGDANSLSQMLAVLHKRTASWINRLDNAPRRKVWHNFWDTKLTLREIVPGAIELCASKRGKTWAGSRGESISMVFGKMVRRDRLACDGSIDLPI